MTEETYYVTICSHDTEEVAGTDLGGFEITQELTDTSIGWKVREMISTRRRRLREREES